MNREQLKKLILGTDISCLEKIPGEDKYLHKNALHDFLHLREFATEYGIDLRLTSSFRDFSRQMTIWNEKAKGIRPVLDSQGVAMDIGPLSEEELMWAILRWNALPGTSRHHWGTDFDCFDESTRPTDYVVQLIPQEIAPGGVFEFMGNFLERGLKQGNGLFHGFFRPYEKDQGGVAPEWWHLSHFNAASEILNVFDLSLMQEIVEESPLELKQSILNHLPKIFNKYVINICLPPLRPSK